MEVSGILHDKRTLHIPDAASWQSNIDHYAHLGGYMFGCGYAMSLRFVDVWMADTRFCSILGGQRPWHRAKPRFAGRGFRLDGMPVSPQGKSVHIQ